MNAYKYICNGKKESWNFGKDLCVASHQTEVFHMNWQQNERHHEIE